MDHSNHGMTTDPDDMHGGHDMSGMSHMMMVFHSGYKETVLFPEWITTNKGEFAATCIGFAIFAILYEALKFLRDVLIEKRLLECGKQKSVGKNNEKESIVKIYLKRILSLENIVQTLLYMLQFTMSYSLMLAFMIANYWLCLSIILGVGVGYFFFGIRRVKSAVVSTHVDDACCE